LWAGLASRAPGLLTGAGEEGIASFLDADDSVWEVHAYAKQAVAYGYTGVALGPRLARRVRCRQRATSLASA